MLYLRITIKTIIMEKQITYEQISQLLDSKLEPIKNDINAIKTDVGFEEVLKVAKKAGDIKDPVTNVIAAGFRALDRQSNDLIRSDI